MNIKRRPSDEIHYPESDGKPMAETDVHRDWMAHLIELLKLFFAGLRVYVSGNLFVYFVQGNPKRSVAPDVFVVKDADPGRRRIFKIWEEGKGPNFIMEVTSDKTRRTDQGKKMQLYAELQVPEYFLYDPLGDWLDPPLQGYRLVGGQYERIEASPEAGIASGQLGITFRLQDGNLVLANTATGEVLKTGLEQAAEARGQMRALEEELARLRAERGQ